MYSVIKNFYKRKFIRNVAAVATGSAAAQAITIAFSPIITRLYGAEAFGVLGVFMAIISVISPVAALTYPIAIVLPKSDADAKELVRLSLYIAVIVASLTSFVLFFFQGQIVGLLQIDNIALYLTLVPLVILIVVSLQVSRQWLIRKKQFSIIAKAEALNAFIINSTKSGIGLFYPFAAVLVLLAVFGQLLHAGILTLGAKSSQSSKHGNGIETASQKTGTIKELMCRHRDFPFYRAPQVLINTISQNLPVLMLASFFGPAPAGFYAICRRVLGMPSRLLGKAVKDVFYPRITEAAHKGENLTFLIIQATTGMAAVGILPFAVIVAFGPWLFGFVFGVEWTTAGEYARWLALMLFFHFINRPSVAAIPLLGIQRGLLVYEFFSTASKIIALYIGFGLFADDKIAIFLFSLAGMVAYICLIIWVILFSKIFTGINTVKENA